MQIASSVCVVPMLPWMILICLLHHVLLQNVVSVTIVSTLSLSGVISTEPLTWKLIKVWLPVNIIFVGMLITSMFRYVFDLQIILS
jgi:hypothetical protein